MKRGRELVPEFVAEGEYVRRVPYALTHLVTETVVAHRRTSEADHGEFRWQQVLAREVIQRRDQLAAGPVAAGAEDDKYARSFRSVPESARQLRPLHLRRDGLG